LIAGAIIFLLVSAGCGFAFMLLISKQLEKVNQTLPERERLLFPLYPAKVTVVRCQYRKLCPESRLDGWCSFLGCAAVFFLLLTVFAFMPSDNPND
jgi:hypothetical protein